MQWVVQLTTTNAIFKTQKKSFLYSFRTIKTRDSQSIKERSYYLLLIISDLFQDIVQITNSCFWKMKANCASAGLTSFLAGTVTAIYLALHTDYPPG